MVRGPLHIKSQNATSTTITPKYFDLKIEKKGGGHMVRGPLHIKKPKRLFNDYNSKTFRRRLVLVTQFFRSSFHTAMKYHVVPSLVCVCVYGGGVRSRIAFVTPALPLCFFLPPSSSCVGSSGAT